jgi:hypothetical protein
VITFSFTLAAANRMVFGGVSPLQKRLRPAASACVTSKTCSIGLGVYLIDLHPMQVSVIMGMVTMENDLQNMNSSFKPEHTSESPVRNDTL